MAADSTVAHDALRALAARALEAATQAPVDREALEGAAPRVRESLERVLAVSDFIASACTGHPGFLAQLLQDPALVDGSYGADLGRTLRAGVAQASSEAEAMTALRRRRRHELARIAWRAIAGWATEKETLS